MPTLFRDFETKSELKLDKVGVHRYAADESTQILCMGYTVDDGPIKLWHPGDRVPPECKEASRNPEWRAVAHNAAFEMSIERGIMWPRHDFPLIPPERNICTMTDALAMALPGKLELCAKALGIEERKDKAGRRAMLQTTKPRRARKNEDPDDVHWYDDDARLELVDGYCMQDVALERQIFNALCPLSPEEYEMWLLDQRINNRGFFIDHKLALAANKIVEETYPLLDQELCDLTEGVVQTVNEVAQMKTWLQQHCRVITDDLDKETVEQLLASTKDAKARRLLEIRQLGAHAAVKKIGAFLTRRGIDGRVRGEFQYHAAGTGRWSSRGVQVQNLKRLPDDFDYETAIKVINKGSQIYAAKIFSQPLKAIGTLMRPMIIAANDHELWGADFSGIEARVTAWLAGQEDKLEVFRRYDRKEGPDPYVVTAAAIYAKPTADIKKEERQIGKACELAFGFQGGVNAFRRFSPTGGGSTTPAQSLWNKRHGKGRSGGESGTTTTADFSDKEVEKFRDAWRNAHPKIRAYWYALNDCFWDAIHNPGIIQSANRKVEIVYDADAFCLPIIWTTLPSSRRLSYPDARVRRAMRFEQANGETGFSSRGVYFKDNTAGRWRDVRMYGGLACENVTQAVARDLLAEALKRLDAAGFKIVTHTHDEVVCEERKGSNRFEQFNDLMNMVPDWATGLPVMAKPWKHARYVK